LTTVILSETRFGSQWLLLPVTVNGEVISRVKKLPVSFPNIDDEVKLPNNVRKVLDHVRKLWNGHLISILETVRIMAHICRKRVVIIRIS